MTNTIEKYLSEGVLNYVEHETPRHYFLYDGVMDENNSDIHRLVEDLCDENMELQQTVDKLYKALEIYKRERDRFKHNKPEITGAYFLAGGYGNVDDNQLPEYVEIVPAYGCGWSQVYEKIERTISYEGS